MPVALQFATSAHHHQDDSTVSVMPIPDAPSHAGSSKYIPPQLRAAQLEEKSRGNKEKAEELMKLERKAQGLLNR